MTLTFKRLAPDRRASGAGSASADAAGTTYTTSPDTKLKVGSTAVIYNKDTGTPFALQGGATDGATTVDGTGKATWVLAATPAAGVRVEFYGVVVGSGGTVPTPGAAPANLTLPSISGTAQVGSVLTRVNGTWSGTAPITYSHQWYANGVLIPGATGATYTPVDGDVGKAITIKTTASNAVGSVTVTSAATSAVVAAVSSNGLLLMDGTAYLLMDGTPLLLLAA
jgi:hypothetical protein